MGFKSAVKDTLGKTFGVKRWAHVDELKEGGATIGRMVGKVFKPYGTEKGAGNKKESFEECVKRYGLTEKDIQRKLKDAIKIVLFCLALSIGTLYIMYFQFSNGRTISGLTCLMLTLVLWAQAFREHFNYFQIKQRRLGCSVKDWLVGTLKGSK